MYKYLGLLTTLALAGCSSFIMTATTIIPDPEVAAVSYFKQAPAYLWGNSYREVFFKSGFTFIPLYAGDKADYPNNRHNVYCLRYPKFQPCERFSKENNAKFSNNYLVNDHSTMELTVGKVVNEILAEYARVRHSPSELLNFIKKYNPDFTNDENNPLIALMRKDLARAYNQSSENERAIIEPYLIAATAFKMSDFKVSKSNPRQLTDQGLFNSIGATGRDYQFSALVTSNPKVMPVKYGRYEVTIKARFDFDYHPAFTDDNSIIQTQKIVLSTANHFKGRVTFTLKGVPTSGKVQMAGLNILAGLAKMLGYQEDLSDIKEGISFELLGIKPKYQVVDVKPLQ